MMENANVTYLANFCYEYLKHLAKIYGFAVEGPQWEEFKYRTQIVLLRYNPSYGIKLHIDNIARANSGPIATVSLGPPTVTYDLTPTLSAVGVPIRLVMGEGDIVVMDGKSRLEWAHALPFNNHYYKYTVIFKFDAFENNQEQVGYQQVLERPIYEMPPAQGCVLVPAPAGAAPASPAGEAPASTAPAGDVGAAGAVGAAILGGVSPSMADLSTIPDDNILDGFAG